MSNRKGLLAPQNTFLDTIATRFDGTHSNFVLGNARSKEYPIVYCSDGFCELTGYGRGMVMSKPCTCAFLFGNDTTDDEKEKIANALSQQIELKTELILYKKNGAPFWCLLDLVPIKNEKGNVVLFLVSHKDITREKVSTNESSIGETRQQLKNAARSTTTTAARQLADTKAENAAEEERNEEEGVQVTISKPLSETSDAEAEAEADADSDAGADADADRSLAAAAPESAITMDIDDDDGDQMRPNREYLQKRRRSRAVLYHISGQFRPKSKNKLQLNHLQNLSGQKPLPEYKVQDLRTQKFIVPHFGIMRIGWDWLILFCTFYIAFIVPYHAAFNAVEDGFDANEQALPPFTDIIIEIMFMVDILLNFRTTFVNKSGQVVYDGRSIAINYLKGWFVLDLAAAIPFEILFALSVETGHLQVHLLKLCRMLRLVRLLQKIDRYTQYSALVLALLMAMFALLAHWMACIWYVIGKTELNSAQSNWTVGWLGELGNRMASPFSVNKTGGPSITARYVSALYFTCSSLTSVGFGNVSANTVSEKIFSVCAMLLGSLMHAAVFGNVTAIIQRMYARRAAYQTKSNDLKDFMRIHHIPKSLKQRMQEFFQTMWSINHGIDHSEILTPFPEELRGDIALHLYRDMLSLPIFESASPGCRKKLAYQCRYRFCTPGECLLHAGDSVTNLYYIANGSMEIVRDGEVVAIMGKSDLFGTDFRQIRLLNTPVNKRNKCEAEIRQQLAMLRSQCDVRSLTYCDMQLLDTDKLVTVLLQYPEFSQKFCTAIRQDISYTLDESNSSDCPSPTATIWPPPALAKLTNNLNGVRGDSTTEEADRSGSDDSEGDDDECFLENTKLVTATNSSRSRCRNKENSPASLPSISEADEVCSSRSEEKRSESARPKDSESLNNSADLICVEQHNNVVCGEQESNEKPRLGRCFFGSKSSDAIRVAKPAHSAVVKSLSAHDTATATATATVTATATASADPHTNRALELKTDEAAISAAPQATRNAANADVLKMLQENRGRIDEVHGEVQSIQRDLRQLGERFEQLINVLGRRHSASFDDGALELSLMERDESFPAFSATARQQNETPVPALTVQWPQAPSSSPPLPSADDSLQNANSRARMRVAWSHPEIALENSAANSSAGHCVEIDRYPHNGHESEVESSCRRTSFDQYLG